jgi:hypothetical protein
MLEKGVHGTSSVVRYLEAYTVNAFFGHSQHPICRDIKGEALA